MTTNDAAERLRELDITTLPATADAITADIAKALAAERQPYRDALAALVAALDQEPPSAVVNCVTHHGCSCREWANERYMGSVDALAAARRLVE